MGTSPLGPVAVVVGGANLDVLARSAVPAVAGTSNPGTTSTSPGGVGRNVAEALARLGTTTHLLAVVGEDPAGREVLEATRRAGVLVDHVRRSATRTGSYTAVLDHDGELVVAVSDMAATEQLDPAAVAGAHDLLAAADLVVLDGNLAPATLRAALDLAADLGVDVVVEPVSVPKARRLAGVLDGTAPVHTVTPNLAELAALVGRPVLDDAEDLDRATRELHARGVAHVWVRRGPAGSLLCSADGGATARSAYAAPAVPVVDVTGAGDAMLAAYCHVLLAGLPLEDAVAAGHRAAAATVTSPHTVRPDLADHVHLDRRALP